MLSDDSSATTGARSDELFKEHQDDVFRRTDRLFAYLMIVQWVVAIGFAIFLSPYAWAGKVKVIHAHVYVAVFLGGAITSLPVLLAFLRPGAAVTRHVIAVAQMLWSALLIHLTGGRIETHFHVFGSLAFVAFYRDWRVLVPATVTVATDHVVRQFLWPESVYGLIAPESWRFLEHAAWVVFEDVILVMACLRGTEEIRSIANKRAEIEALSEQEKAKSAALDEALAELRASQETLVRTEKLAAVGQLAASVGHELRNPLAAVRNASTYLQKKVTGPDGGAGDPRVPQFFGVMDRELSACMKIISDLLDFARERPPELAPCPLHPLVDEAIEVVIAGDTKIENQVPPGLPVPELDREQFRQILINLMQNAVEALPPGTPGRVVVRANGGGERPFTIVVEDNGAGMPPEVARQIFEPLYTTKTKGTGLGLAVVSTIIKRHHGSIGVKSEPGQGTTFTIEIPPARVAQPVE